MKFAETMKLVEAGADKGAGSKGVTNIQDWEKALAEVDAPGAKGLHGDLESLRKQLEKEEPDAERVASLLHKLGAATTKIADHAEGSQDKLKSLGEALTKAGKA